MTWGYTITDYATGNEEHKAGFDTFDETKDACDERLLELLPDPDCDDHDYDCTIAKYDDDDELFDLYPNADAEELEEELMDNLDK